VIITPHIGGLSDQMERRAVEFISGNIIRFEKGEKLKNIVNLELGY
jgi:phosphoglycerate dehydrogenase-like enzyme